MWVACPKNRHIEICKNILFVDLQNDVYAAFYPFQARAMNQSEFNENYYRFTWLFDSDKLGALILEVGILEDHGTFLNFKDMILNQTYLNSPFTNQLEYTSTFGKKLLMKYMPTTSYTLIDGTVIDSAGVIPRVWCDGNEIDFKTWNSYEVVYGERIVDQKWGSGILRAIVNGKGLEIIVEPEDASIRYKTIQNSKR